jgi:acyl-CoA reductase-like NAD-dependent aldehyde dehydrogenase
VNLVFGGGHEVGEALVAHPGIDYVSFTGSVAVGARVGELAGGKLRRAILELGGKNAAVVLADADLQLAAEAIVWGAFGTSGQRCTATSRLIVERTVHDALLERLVARTKALKVGNGLAEDVDVGPVVSREALLRIHGYVERAVAEGAHLVVGGRVLSEGEFAKGFFYEPTILDDVRPEMEIAQEEVFGPVLAVITVDSLEEAIEVHNATSYGLSASIFTADVARAFAAVRAFAAGIVYVNHSTSGAEIHLPFGGVRQSGNGHREAGPTALDAYSEWKTVYIDYSGRLQRAQIDTEERTRW